MKKNYYLQQEVNIGDVIEIGGFKVNVTIDLITNNPEKFTSKDVTEYLRCIVSENYEEFTQNKVYEVQHDDDEVHNCLTTNTGWKCRREIDFNDLIYYESKFELATKDDFDNYCLFEEAKKRYPVGTRFGVAHMPEIIFSVANHNWHDKSILVNSKNDIHINFFTIETDKNVPSASVYSEGKWAKIFKNICKSQDGVDIYDGDSIFFVETDGDENDMAWKPQSRTARSGDRYFRDDNGVLDVIPFVNLAACKTWIAENKPKEKDLDFYENKFIGTTGYTLQYQWLKKAEPKAFYTVILQAIADDLNDGWKPDFSNKSEYKYIIRIVYGEIESIGFCKLTYSTPIFKSKEIAEKAIKIMSDKLYKIF